MIRDGHLSLSRPTARAQEFSTALTRALGFSAGEARLIFDALDSEGRRDGAAVVDLWLQW